MKLISRLQDPQRRTEAQVFLKETYPFPIHALLATAVFVGNVAVTLVAIAAMN